MSTQSTRLHGRVANTLITAMRLMLLAFLALSASACDSGRTRYYSAEPITAWVVDDDTGAPIAGANVIAAWEMKAGLENHITNYVMVMEAVTDDTGKFSFPAWGPKPVTEPGRVLSGAPILTIFKSGYSLGGGANLGVLDPAPAHMSSYWDGKTLKMRHFSGTPDEYAQYLNLNLEGTVESLLLNGCNGKSFPRFLLAIDRQSQEFELKRTKMPLPGLQQMDTTVKSKCESIARYVKELGP